MIFSYNHWSYNEILSSESTICLKFAFKRVECKASIERFLKRHASVKQT